LQGSAGYILSQMLNRDDVPGMSKMLGERCSSHARASVTATVKITGSIRSMSRVEIFGLERLGRIFPE
jgi:hypothetical protein